VVEAKMKTTPPSRSTSSARHADDVDPHRLEHHQSKGNKGRVLRERSLSFQEGLGGIWCSLIWFVRSIRKGKGNVYLLKKTYDNGFGCIHLLSVCLKIRPN
jgi:hypothetical protein